MSKALDDIAAERQRQISEEGWTFKHDDKHDQGEIARAASAYALGGSWPTKKEDKVLARELEEKHGSQDWQEPLLGFITRLWPWHQQWWKPAGRRRNLVKAGALIVAEIERLDRIAAKQSLSELIAAAREVNRLAVERAQVRAEPDPLYREHMYADARRLDEAFQAYDQSLQPQT